MSELDTEVIEDIDPEDYPTIQDITTEVYSNNAGELGRLTPHEMWQTISLYRNIATLQNQEGRVTRSVIYQNARAVATDRDELMADLRKRIDEDIGEFKSYMNEEGPDKEESPAQS